MPKWNQILEKKVHYYNYYNISMKGFEDKRQRRILKLNSVGFDFMLLLNVIKFLLWNTVLLWLVNDWSIFCVFTVVPERLWCWIYEPHQLFHLLRPTELNRESNRSRKICPIKQRQNLVNVQIKQGIKRDCVSLSS